MSDRKYTHKYAHAYTMYRNTELHKDRAGTDGVKEYNERTNNIDHLSKYCICCLSCVTFTRNLLSFVIELKPEIYH